MPHISSAQRDLGVILINIFYLEVPYWWVQTGTENFCYGTQNEQENTHDNVIEGDIRGEMTVDTDQNYQ